MFAFGNVSISGARSMNSYCYHTAGGSEDKKAMSPRNGWGFISIVSERQHDFKEMDFFFFKLYLEGKLSF